MTLDEGQALVISIRNEEPGAFDSLVKLTLPLVNGILWQGGARVEDWDDIKQTAYWLIYRSLTDLSRNDVFRGDCSLLTWTRRIFYNAMVQWGRANQSRERWKDRLGKEPRDNHGTGKTKFESVILAKNELPIVWSLLTDEEREIFFLHEVEDLMLHEIADRLEISVNTVKVKLFRARKRIKEQMERNAHREATEDGVADLDRRMAASVGA